MGHLTINVAAMWASLAWMAWTVRKSTMDLLTKMSMWGMFGGMALMLWLMGDMGLLGNVAMWAMLAGMALMLRPTREMAARILTQATGRQTTDSGEPDNTDIRSRPARGIDLPRRRTSLSSVAAAAQPRPRHWDARRARYGLQPLRQSRSPTYR